MNRRGYLQVYTGDGKGKTTAAIGLAVRAAGAGWKVFFAQFIKRGRFSEIIALERFKERITLRQYGRGCFIKDKPSRADVAAARRGLAEAGRAIASGEYDLVVLDEANCAVRCGLFGVEELLMLIERRPEHVEVVVTGRDAHRALLDRADLVTEMRNVKHYYSKGVKARKGIER